MKTINQMVFVMLAFLTVSNFTTAQETIVIQDALQGSTVGSRVGGSLTSEGYKPGIGSGHILYDSPSQVTNGYIQFEMKGFVPSLIQDPNGGGDADNGVFGMYDGRGIGEPIPYFDAFKANYFRWNFHYRQNRSAFKSVLTVAAPISARINSTYAVFPYRPDGTIDRDWFAEPTGSNYSFNSTSWYTVRCEWRNKVFTVTINGSAVWQVSGPYDYAPIDFKIWLGSAPGFDDKYTNMIQNVVYRNFKLVSYGGVQPPNNSAPVITSSPVTSGLVGQLYTYDVETNANPNPTYSLTTKPTGMTINSTTGLVQWTPTATGSFNVTVKATNGVSPDATQSFTVNVTQNQQNTAPVITSTPVTSGNVGQLYEYDVETNANPNPAYSLTTKPTGMTINSTSGLIQWTPTATGNFNVTVKAANGVNPDATQSFIISVPGGQTGGCPSSMLSYWKLDEASGSLFDDYVGTNNGTSTDVPALTTGRVNAARLFNGTSNWITAPRIAAYDFAVNTSFTFEAWIKHNTGSNTGEKIIVERKSSDEALAINLKMDNTVSATFSVRNDRYDQIFAVTGKKNLYDNIWHHVVGVRDASTNQLRIYIDGVLESTVSAVYSAGFTSVDEGISIGRRRSTNNKFFQGSIDEVAIHNVALDAASILQHYNNGLQNNGYCGTVQPPVTNCPPNLISYWKLDEASGSLFDDYVGTNNGTSTDVPALTTGRVNAARLFNGTSNWITAPRIAAYDFAVNTSFTFEAWIKHNTGSNTGEKIIVERKSSDEALAINLKMDNTVSATFSVRNDRYDQIFAVTGKKNLYDNIWHHVVGVRDASTNQLRIYIDGVLESTVSAVYSAGFTSVDEGISIGRRRSTNNKFFQGSIDEVAIHNVALDAASILQHYNNGLQNLGYCQAALGKMAANSTDIFSSIENNVTGSNILLKWETTNELQEGKFEIERSVNPTASSNDWQKIGEIDLSTSAGSRSFAYTDKPNSSGKFSYRIKFAKDEVVVYSKQIETEVLPTDYVLYQNYPNPFNPSTKIRFAVPSFTKVSIQIYNQLGELVAQPINNSYEAGNYEVEVNMSNHASGVYFYKISAGTFSAIKKMMLTK